MKKIIYCILFVAIFIFLFIGMDTLVSKKYLSSAGESLSYYKNSQKAFYDIPKESLDFIFIGSSHTANGIIPQRIWEESGVSTYALTAAGIMPWTVFYYTKEVLKLQTPKAILIDAYTMVFDGYQTHFIESNDNSAYFLRFSMDKLDDILTQQKMMQLYSPLKAKSLGDYTSIAQSHDRWKSLTKGDFDYLRDGAQDQGLYGYIPNFAQLEDPIVYKTFDDISIEEFPGVPFEISWQYLDMAISACREQNVEPVLLIIPFAKTRMDEVMVLKLKDYAAENDIKIIDMFALQDELNLDMQADFYNSTHLNYWGATKVSAWLGEYLAGEYDLSARTNVSLQDMWEDSAPVFSRHVENYKLSNITDTNTYVSRIAEDGLLTILCTPSSSSEWIDESKSLSLLLSGIDLSPERVYVIKEGELLFETSSISRSLFLYDNLQFMFDGWKINIDDYYGYTFHAGAVNICVVDPWLRRPVDRVFIYESSPDTMDR